jgi:catechol 2,3-dioxygenase-like lactoylglutathione lyase family enzyme
MIGFVMIGTNNLDKATKFYDTLLATIELYRVVTNEKYAGYGLNEKPDEVEFYVTNPVNKEKATFGNGTQISFLVNSKDIVNSFLILQ